MGREITERAQFDIIRYANCWEDADVLLSALDVKAGGSYLSVASAGDNTLAILSRGPSFVLGVDISNAQLACTELRAAAFRTLSYEDMLRFLGIRPEERRHALYEELRGGLSRDARDFWDAHPDTIASGIIHAGKFERYFKLFRNFVLPLVHGRDMISELLLPKDERQRDDFYGSRWDTWRWRMIFRIFFSRAVMGRLGRDPEFFRYVEGDVATRILQRAEYALTALPTHDNPYLEFILTGTFGNALPSYLRQENFSSIRANIDKLVLFRGSASAALLHRQDVRFDGFNLSDIFEYMSYDDYLAELGRFIASSAKGARLVYWNMLADRKPPAEFSGRIKHLERSAEALFLRDKAFFYKALRIEQVQ